MEKDQDEVKKHNPSEGETNTNNGPEGNETSKREEPRQPHELPSADLPIMVSQNSSNGSDTTLTVDMDVFNVHENSQGLYIIIEDMDVSELVNILMNPLDPPEDTIWDEEDTFNFETILKHKNFQDDNIEIINVFEDDLIVVSDYESFDDE